MGPTVGGLDNPLDPFLRSQGCMILDGGLATELESRGADLSDELWSARLLLDQPDLIREVHQDYLSAGADCIASASYQATIEGFVGRGLTDGQAQALIERSVDLAHQARENFWSIPGNRQGRLRPLVAASVGPYGAYLADGSEFRGDYDLNRQELERFHRRRWEILSSSGADLLACETLPSHSEALALRGVLESTPHVSAWFSFSCMGGDRISDGSHVETVARSLDDCPQIVALGVNCTPPRYLAELIAAFRRGTDKPIVVYPNSGESWDAEARCWVPNSGQEDTLESAGEIWLNAGASVLGGCCRTGPEQIRKLRQRLLA